MAGYGTFEDVMDALETAVSVSAYVCGDQFTAADVYVGSQIGWGLQFGTIEKRGAFEAYSARLRQREAAVRASQLDDADMAKVTPPQMAAPPQPAA
jgi:glutathione S-transferase